jgi:beta-RFAP synthase
MHATVATPSRLHFGLLRFEQPAGRSYGGLGMMLRSPRTVVEVAPAIEWSAAGPDADRALAIAQTVLTHIAAADKPPALHVCVAEAIPAHRGLGAGTQLGCAVAAAVRAVLDLAPGSAEQLAALAGRGVRSAVGSHGFIHGGLVWELGRRPSDALGQLNERVAVPPDWRVVLIAPREQHGLSGAPEITAFEALPPVPESTVRRLTQLAEEQILTAARTADLGAFGEAVYQYGRLAGECFAFVQGGCYATPQTAECVAAIRDLGIPGAGQSSWGPTVFALTSGQGEAQQLVERLSRRFPPSRFEYEITAPNNDGAAITAHVSDEGGCESTPP